MTTRFSRKKASVPIRTKIWRWFPFLLKGRLRHGDSLNNSHTITRGEIQVMSAGTDIQHSEFNDSLTEPLEFLQIWIIPDRINTPPRYRDYDITPLLKHNEISTFLAPETDISIMQQAWFS